MYILGEEELKAVEQTFKTGNLDRYVDGENSVTAKFEREFAHKMGSSNSLAVSSGTAALICGLVGMGVGPGDEVIIPGYTYAATALAVLAVGAIPVITEIDASMGIDPIDIQRKISVRTKAVIPVHMCGLPCNMSAIMDIAKNSNIQVLEDAAQACGGSYGGQRLGSIGHAGIFSFNHYKIISCGEGGALITNDNILFQNALLHHDGGCIHEAEGNRPDIQIPTFAGWNFRLTEILSAILRVQLKRLDDILASLRDEKRVLTERLSDVHEGVRPVISNDSKGDCGTAFFLQFESEKQANLFAQYSEQQKIDVWFPDYSGHVYSDWEPLFEKRGAHHPARDAFCIAQHVPDYTRDMCPNTTSILKRTVGISTDVNRDDRELDVLSSDIKGIIRKVF
ncbi:MAG: aminotransferase class I/II-fold pyridoxal phosphate-dependent enzyme [Candidatus Thiodiazotropha sp.]